jgi:drug/metabolite transporter (DMT)-like permease
MRLTLRDILVITACIVMWGASFPFLKKAVEFIPPMTLGAVRFLPGALLGCAALALARERPVVMERIRTHGRILLGVAAFMVVLPSVFQNLGMPHTTASLASLIQCSSPAFTVFLAPLVLGEILTRRKVTGLGLSFAASVTLVFAGSGVVGGTGTLLGNVLMVATALSYGFAPLCGKTALRSFDPLHIMGVAMAVGAGVLFVLAALLGESFAWIRTMPAEGWVSLVALAFLPGVAAQYLWYTVLRRHEASRLIVVAYLIPVVGIAISFVWLGESLTLPSVLCGLAIFTGVALVQSEPDRRVRPGTEAAAAPPREAP